MIDYIGETRINKRTDLIRVSKSEDVFNEIEEFKDKKQEHFMVIYLDGLKCHYLSRQFFKNLSYHL